MPEAPHQHIVHHPHLGNEVVLLMQESDFASQAMKPLAGQSGGIPAKRRDMPIGGPDQSGDQSE